MRSKLINQRCANFALTRLSTMYKHIQKKNQYIKHPPLTLKTGAISTRAPLGLRQ